MIITVCKFSKELDQFFHSCFCVTAQLFQYAKRKHVQPHADSFNTTIFSIFQRCLREECRH